MNSCILIGPADDRPPDDANAVVTAGAFGQLDQVKHFLEKKKASNKSCLETDEDDGIFLSALIHATSNEHMSIVVYLLDQGVKFDHRVARAAAKAESIPILQLLLDRGWDINEHSGNHAPALWLVMHDESLRTWFFAHGADPNIKNFLGDTPLDYAAGYLCLDDVKALVQNGAQPRSSNAISAAISHQVLESLEIVSFLLDNGADVNQVGRDARDGLDAVSFFRGFSGPLDALDFERLSEHWEQVPSDERDRQFSPLHRAVKYNSPSMVQLLLEHGANPDLDLGLGTPRVIAERLKGRLNPEMAKILGNRRMKRETSKTSRLSHHL